MALAAPAAAQGFNPFGDTQTTRGAYRNDPRPQRLQPLPPPQPQYGYRYGPGYAYGVRPGYGYGRPGYGSQGYGSPYGFDDDDDDMVPPAARPRQALPNQPPVTSDGGPRPSISAKTPPLVAFNSSYGAGNIVIDSSGRALYYVVSSTEAYRYPIAVGREGFSWTGAEKISRKAEWPDWRPPAEMRERQPGLPEVMTGGLRNPLGARAIYLGSTLYRIHGTNDAKSIGGAASSGCFRMTNNHIADLYNRASVGSTVTVVSRLPAGTFRGIASNDTTVPARKTLGAAL